jgi:chaperonin GroEL
MSKKVYLKESRKKLLEGVNLYADAVKSTLGPSGKFVIINNGPGEEPFPTKDGVTVGDSMDSPDPVINTAIQLIKKVASKTDFDNGDGTTTASVLCRELIVLGMKLQENVHFDQHKFKETIYRELDNIIEQLHDVAVNIPLCDIGKVALTSANNDLEIANLFQEAFNNTKEDGYINIVESVTGKSYINIVKGYVVDLGYMDRRFGNDEITGLFKANKCRIVIYDNEFTDKQEMLKLISRSPKNDPLPVVIFAKDYSKEVVGIVDFNNMDRIGNKICLIKNQLRGSEYSDLINDLSNYTGAEPVKHFDEFDSEFGEATNVIVKQGYTIFGDLEGTRKELMNNYLFLLKAAAKEEMSPEYSQQILKRVNRIENGITTFYVGGDSDIERIEKKHRVDDAYKACKIALKGKVIIGGGQALVLLSKDLNKCDDYEMVFHKTIIKPFYEILLNSLHSEESSHEIKNQLSFKNGYNAKTRQFENLYDSGIVDPLDVAINGLKNAVSIAMTILSTECLIVEVGNDYATS